MSDLKTLRDKVDNDLYKVLSNSYQRDEASRKTTALWSNMKINDVIDHDNPETNVITMRAKAELERSLLDLIIQRDSK